MELKPLFDRVIVEHLESKETTASGIFLPVAAQEKSQLAIVVAAGPGGLVDGNEVKMVVSVGDKVLYSKYSGSDFNIDGKHYVIIRQSDILAIAVE